MRHFTPERIRKQKDILVKLMNEDKSQKIQIKAYEVLRMGLGEKDELIYLDERFEKEKMRITKLYAQ